MYQIQPGDDTGSIILEQQQIRVNIDHLTPDINTQLDTILSTLHDWWVGVGM